MFPALDARQLISIKNQRKKTTPYTLKQTADQLISIFYAQDIEQQFTFLYHFFRLKSMRSSLIGLQLHHLMCGSRKIKVIICFNHRSLLPNDSKLNATFLITASLS